MLIAALADAEQLSAVIARVLPGDEAEPGSHVTPILELATIADGGNHRCGDLWSRPFNPGNPLRQRTCPECLIDASVEYSASTVNFSEQVKQLRDRLACADRETILCILQHLRN